MYFLGIDLGSSAIKVGIFDKRGNTISFTSREYLINSTNSKIEKSQNYYWNIVKTTIKEALHNIPEKINKIKSLSISAHTDTIFFIDKKGNDVRPPIFWLDSRGRDEAKEFFNNFSTDELFDITGQPHFLSIFFANRILWLKKNEPENFNKVYKFLQIEDFILYKLTGKFIGDPTVYCESYLFDINKKQYYKPILDFIGLPQNKLVEIINTGTNLGKIKCDTAKDLGLNKNVEIFVGAMDQNCSSIGAGNIKKGIITETTGSVLALLTNTDKPICNHEAKIPCHNQLFGNLYCLLPWTNTAGLVLKWLKNTFYDIEEKVISRTNEDIYDYMGICAQTIPPGSDGLITLPFLDGVYSPINDHNAKGVFFGLTMKHKKEHFVRSIMESIGFMLNWYLEIIKKMGIKVDQIISIGGGAKSQLWCQIKADITGVPIITLENPESSVLGAAIIAAVGSKSFMNYKDACDKMVKIQEQFKPNLNNFEIYSTIFPKFKKLYENNKSLF